jgi:hypothetical protein
MAESLKRQNDGSVLCLAARRTAGRNTLTSMDPAVIEGCTE